MERLFGRIDLKSMGQASDFRCNALVGVCACFADGHFRQLDNVLRAKAAGCCFRTVDKYVVEEKEESWLYLFSAQLLEHAIANILAAWNQQILTSNM